MKTIEVRNSIHHTLLRVIDPKSGLFGRGKAYGKNSQAYTNVGFELSTDFEPTLGVMSDAKIDALYKILVYFEAHMHPLQNLLRASDSEDARHQHLAKTAWSHFSTVIMFGILEIAVKTNGETPPKPNVELREKGKKISDFLRNNLPPNIKDGVKARYSDEGPLPNGRFKSFEDIIDHLWKVIRGGFVHDDALRSIGVEYIEFSNAVGTLKDPIEITSNVPMQEWLQLTWQAILNSYGYKGILKQRIQ